MKCLHCKCFWVCNPLTFSECAPNHSLLIELVQVPGWYFCCWQQRTQLDNYCSTPSFRHHTVDPRPFLFNSSGVFQHSQCQFSNIKTPDASNVSRWWTKRNTICIFVQFRTFKWQSNNGHRAFIQSPVRFHFNSNLLSWNDRDGW